MEQKLKEVLVEGEQLLWSGKPEFKTLGETHKNTFAVKAVVVAFAAIAFLMYYLIGVKKHIIEQCFDAECHDTLQKLYAHKGATIIRYLCKLRTTLFQKFKKTDTEMRYNLMNLDRLEWYDHDNIKQLAKWGINVIKPNYRAEQYMHDLTKLISENIDACSELFYDWVNWAYIRELFCII